MNTASTRERTSEALKRYDRELFHILRAFTVEGVMRWSAQDQRYGGETGFWGTTGLLYDTDFEVYPEQHCIKALELLKEVGAEDELIHIVYSHGYSLVSDMRPECQVEEIPFASDELTGPIGAAVRMCPPRSVVDMEVSSPRKKFKDKRLAAGCSRDIIRGEAEELDWILEEFMDKTAQAIHSCEAAVSGEMRLYEA